jgi:hypothetical protein
MPSLTEGLAMRIEATLPEPRALQLKELANEFNVSKSAILDEALSLLMTALMGARSGRRVALIDASQKVVSEVATPLLTQLEWTASRTKIVLSQREAEKVDALLADPPEPTPALRKAMAHHRSKKVK